MPSEKPFGTPNSFKPIRIASSQTDSREEEARLLENCVSSYVPAERLQGDDACGKCAIRSKTRRAGTKANEINKQIIMARVPLSYECAVNSVRLTQLAWVRQCNESAFCRAEDRSGSFRIVQRERASSGRMNVIGELHTRRCIVTLFMRRLPVFRCFVWSRRWTSQTLPLSKSVESSEYFEFAILFTHLIVAHPMLIQ